MQSTSSHNLVTEPAERTQRIGWIGALIRLYLTIAVPVLLTLVSVRLVMTPQFLHFEYQRADFPEDYYGFTQEDRLQLAPYALTYLINNKDINYLADLEFPDGSSLFQASELRHMQDVQAVTQAAFLILLAAAMGVLLIMAWAWRNKDSRFDVRQGLLQAALLTLTVIITIVILAITAWDVFFTGFHQLFFENGTWRFAYSDSLIRLFPERFWFDAAIFVGTLTTIGAVAILIVVWWWHKHTHTLDQST